MAITAAQVKELRERTGEGMMTCKKALVETNGDIELAIENMRKSGALKAAKKAGRVAAEGIVVVESSEAAAALVEINSETDFVARDDSFLAFSKKVGEIALASKPASLQELLDAEYGEVGNVEAARQALIAKIGENINVRRVSITSAEDGVVSAYIHGTRIGVVIALKGGDVELAKDVAMHVAATNPQVISGDDVSQDVLDKEKEIFSAQALESGKPAEIVEKMVVGRLKKFVAEISLTGQAFVKDPSQTVGQLLKAANAEVVSMTRFEVGEGIEKKEEDFAAEVMAQVKGA